MQTNEITNIAAITVLPVNMEDSYTSELFPGSIGATVLEARKGNPNTVISVNANNWQEKLGIPFPKSAGTKREGLFHLKDALTDGCQNVNVIRVVASDAKFPTLSLDDTPALTTGAEAYGTEIVLSAGELLTIWPKDGDPSTTRKVAITEVPGTIQEWTTATEYTLGDLVKLSPTSERFYSYGDWKWALRATGTFTSGATIQADIDNGDLEWVEGVSDNRFKLTFYETDQFGREYILEEFVVGIDPLDKAEDGRSCYVETMLDEQSEYFSAKYNDSVAWAGFQPSLATFVKTAFVGGTNGGTPVAADFTAAWDTYKNQNIDADLMFMAGNYDSAVIAHAITVAEERGAFLAIDVIPTVEKDAAVSALLSMTLESRYAGAYYCPWKADDVFFNGKAVWGCSGDVIAACARGNRNMAGGVPGVYYAPAGIKRAKLSRSGLEQLYPKNPFDVAARQKFVNARLNPVVISSGGGAVIDDTLALYYEDNYGRFIHITRLANYIDKRFLIMATQAKFDPDGLTYRKLNDGMETIMDDMVAAGALVKPRDPAKDGSSPYTITITQKQIDLWLVEYAYCPVGFARRIAGQPRWIK